MTPPRHASARSGVLASTRALASLADRDATAHACSAADDALDRAKLDAEARNHATNVYTVAHAFLEMGATPEQHSNLVVHSLGAATATVGQSQDPNAM